MGDKEQGTNEVKEQPGSGPQYSPNTLPGDDDIIVLGEGEKPPADDDTPPAADKEPESPPDKPSGEDKDVGDKPAEPSEDDEPAKPGEPEEPEPDKDLEVGDDDLEDLEDDGVGGRVNKRIRQLVTQRNEGFQERDSTIQRLRDENAKLKAAGEQQSAEIPFTGESDISVEEFANFDFDNIGPDNIPPGFTEPEPDPEAYFDDDNVPQETKLMNDRMKWLGKMRSYANTLQDKVTERQQAAQAQAETVRQTRETFIQHQEKHIGSLDEGGQQKYAAAAANFRTTAAANMVEVRNPATGQVEGADPSMLIDAVMQSEHAPKLIEYFGEHPEVQEKLHQMAPYRCGEELGRIKRKILGKGVAAKPGVKAPEEPPVQLGGNRRGAAPQDEWDIAENGTMDEYMEKVGL